MKAFVKRNYPYIMIVLIALFIRSFLFEIILIQGPSMEPNLKNAQLMVLNKNSYATKEPERFDIVVLKKNNVQIVKRIIGLPGELVNYQNNVLYINKKPYPVKIKFTKTGNFPREVRVRPGYYFLLGDNRSESADSRIFGSIHETEILGEVSLSLIPFKTY